jgi:putative peptide zinc metalloprotease protein
MNLAEALDVLPELTAPTKSTRIFRIDPLLVGREHVEEGEKVILAHVPGSTNLFRLTLPQWELAHFFDGARSYEEIASLFSAQSSTQANSEDVRMFAEMMEDSKFWYQSPQEKNAALMEKLRDRRKKQKKTKAGDMAHIVVAKWDLDEYIDIAHRKLQFVFTPWFTLITLILFAFTTYVFVTHWSQIGIDTLEYYTFTDKSVADLAEFWILFFVMAFFHESAHAVTCKHYGGGVHGTGFHLIYLTPAFFVDVTEVWVYANRFQRVITCLVGIWTELIICSVATVVWWGTPPGGAIHDLAYKVILIAGIAVVLMNLNPLVKLDGYYVMSETLGIDGIKERSTALTLGWIQKHIFGLPVEVHYVRPLLRWFFVPYSILSGLYSYLLLYAAARLVGNIFHHFAPEWAFVPTAIVAFLIFKSRIIKLGKFMRTVAVEKRDFFFRLRNYIAGFAIILLVLLAIPVFTKTLQARFILEPAQRALVRAEVPGTVAEVLVHEGQTVARDAPVLRLRNLSLESQQAAAEAELRRAHARYADAQARYAGLAATQQEVQQTDEKSHVLARELKQLELRSPIAGKVVTALPESLLGSRLSTGASAVEIADLSSLRARIFVSEAEMRDVHLGQKVSLRPDSSFRSLAGVVSEIGQSSSEIEPGLQPTTVYKGLAPPHYYGVSVWLSNPGNNLLYGMSGTAKIRTERRSILGLAGNDIYDFVRRKVW